MNIELLSVVPAFLFFMPVFLKIRLLMLQSNVGALNTSENQKNAISATVYHQFYKYWYSNCLGCVIPNTNIHLFYKNRVRNGDF